MAINVIRLSNLDKSMLRRLLSPHPLERFDVYFERPGNIVDYVKKLGLYKGSYSYFNCRIKRNGLSSVYFTDSGDKCLIRSGSPDVIVFEQIFLFGDYDIDFNVEPDIIVDAGAHIGLSSLYFLTRYPNANLICIEPNIDNFNLLKNNLGDYQNTTLLNRALWYKSGEVYFSHLNAVNWAHRICDEQSSNAVQAVDVEELLNQHDLHHISILKIDIEGAEKELFENNPKWINRVDYMVIEMHDHIRMGSSQAVEKAVSDDMQLVCHQGENWIFARKELAGN